MTPRRRRQQRRRHHAGPQAQHVRRQQHVLHGHRGADGLAADATAAGALQSALPTAGLFLCMARMTRGPSRTASRNAATPALVPPAVVRRGQAFAQRLTDLLRELANLPAVFEDDELPALAVVIGRGPLRRLDQSVRAGPDLAAVGKGPHGPPRPQHLEEGSSCITSTSRRSALRSARRSRRNWTARCLPPNGLALPGT